jgi:hypothetical protein
MMRTMKNKSLAVAAWAHTRLVAVGRRERGDVVGWALIAVMSLIVVGALFAFLGPQLRDLLESALNQARNSYNG